MHIPAWIWFSLVILLSWGLVGLLQKLSTNHLTAESSLIWTVVGFQVMQPLLYHGSSIFHYSIRNLSWALLGGVLNALGAWALLAAMKSGGKASIVATLTALYPLVVIPVAPFIFHESLSLKQGIGIACALAAVLLLSVPSPGMEGEAPQ